jgi:23S rRNA G2069 N7-methylase RlmK/C1962 C5-methylase RlmI
MIKDTLIKALENRVRILREDSQEACRLFTGFYEGEPNLVADLYGRTLLLSSYSEDLQMVRRCSMKRKNTFSRVPRVTLCCKNTGLRKTRRYDGARSLWERCDNSIIENGGLVRY